MRRLSAATAGQGGSPTQYVPPDAGFTFAPGYPGGTFDYVGASLTDGSGITIQSNQTYSFYKNLQWGNIGTPSSPVHNVTFIGCLWEADGPYTAAVVPACNGDVTFRYCTIRPTGMSNHTAIVPQASGYQYGIVTDGTLASPGTWNSFVDGGTLLVDHCDIWGFANATKTEASTQANPHIFTYNWVHNSRRNTSGDDHTDGIGSPGGGASSYVQIKYNWIEDDGDTNGLAFQNTNGGNYDHFEIVGNVFGGFGYTIAILNGTYPVVDPPTNLTFTDNVLSTKIRPYFGPIYDASIVGHTGTVWRRNRLWVPPGAAWGNPGDSGKYWLPNAQNIVGNDSSPFVSTADYI